MNLTQLAKDKLEVFLQKNETSIAIDLTAGNGFDTLFLATKVGENGKVFAFDIQEDAISSTRTLLEKNNLLHKCEFFLASHHRLKNYLDNCYFGKINVAMLNLGWLPKSDKKIITKTKSTLLALKALEDVLDGKNNLVSILSYRGHLGGEEEFWAVKDYIKQFKPEIFTDEKNPKSPVLFLFSVN